MNTLTWWRAVLGVGVLAGLAVGSVRAGEAAADTDAPPADAPWFITKYDADGDGTISDSEREAAKTAWKAKQKQRDLKKFDADGDGQLSAEEQGQADAARAARKQKLKERFDKDGDGKLSEAEKAEMTKHWGDRKHEGADEDDDKADAGE